MLIAKLKFTTTLPIEHGEPGKEVMVPQEPVAIGSVYVLLNSEQVSQVPLVTPLNVNKYCE